MNAFYYDTPGVSFDAPGVSFDGQVQGLGKDKMKVALKLYQYTPLELIQLTRDIVTAMTGNAAFPAPTPPLTSLTAAADTVAAKIDAYEAARVAATVAMTERDAAVSALIALLNDEANTVQTVSGGDPAIIQSAGMGVRAPNTPPQPMPQPVNLRVDFTDASGELELRWKAIPRVRNYVVEMTSDPAAAAGWSALAFQPTSARYLVDGLTSGQKYWFRIRANGVKGPGPASDPASRIAP